MNDIWRAVRTWAVRTWCEGPEDVLAVTIEFRDGTAIQLREISGIVRALDLTDGIEVDVTEDVE